ncbi:MAG: vWA domain-containing protein [Akkermansiaceae bacterium]
MVAPTPILVAAAVAVLALGAELLHTRRIRRVRHLAFGPQGRFPLPVVIAPILRVLFLGALGWSLTTLLFLNPKAHRSKVKFVEPKERRHLLVVLDVSPSMKLKDSGGESQLTRTQRASKLVESLLQRTSDNKLHVTLVAVYNGAKPVVEESRDLEVILNFLDGMDLSSVFPTGKTQLLAGIKEAARIAHDWPANSATLLVISDGDSVPASGMPKMPPSIGGVLVMGVGNPTKGSMVDGRQSRQDVGALQQIASRLGGHYHDGNTRHVPTAELDKLGSLKIEDDKLKLTLREYALITAVASGVGLALLPVLLYFFASPFNPGKAKP